jgi:hypothetical protein
MLVERPREINDRILGFLERTVSANGAPLATTT